MNLELAFVKNSDIEAVKNLVSERLVNGFNSSFESVLPNEFCFMDSYEILRDNTKRKVALSPITDGWISLVESKEVNDYAMLLHISDALGCDVFAAVVCDAIGAFGFVIMRKGSIVECSYSEDEEYDDILNEKLQSFGIKMPFFKFREAVQKGSGWSVVKK